MCKHTAIPGLAFGAVPARPGFGAMQPMGLAQKSGVLSVVAKYEYYYVRVRYLVGHNTLIIRFAEPK